MCVLTHSEKCITHFGKALRRVRVYPCHFEMIQKDNNICIVKKAVQFDDNAVFVWV